MNSVQSTLRELKRRLVGRIECSACGKGEPDDLLLMTLPSGALICHSCLDRAVTSEVASAAEVQRCISCGASSVGTAGRAIGKVWMCATCQATAASKLAADRTSWSPAT